jgi:hypothetical protein
MSRKKDKDRDRHVPSPETVGRHLKKGNFREALKDAKLCFRSEASESNRALLEETFLQRIQQLHHDKQPTDAKAVLADLMAIGPTSPKVLENIARLRVLLGETGAGSQAVLQSNPALVIEIADNAVLDANVVVPNYADLPQQVNAVRNALLLVEKGDDAQAIEQLAIISRGSPLADWRLFIRGLSAFYLCEDERAESNWSRLEQHRPAARIARTLRLAAKMPGSADQPGDIHVEDGAERLLNSVADPIVPLLKQLAEEWKNPNRRRFFRTYRLLRHKFGETHTNVLRQVVDVVWKWAVRNANGSLLNELAGIGPTPEFDPQWNRGRALLAEHPDDPSDLGDIEAHWVAYAADVQALEFLSDADRRMAQGLVYQRLADTYGNAAIRLKEDEIDEIEDDEVSFLVRKSIEFYREGIQACPQLEACYLCIVKLYEQFDQIDNAAKVMEELGSSNPNSFEAARWLASHYLSQDNPGKASLWVSAAQRLRPRDQGVAELLWNQKLTMARGLVLNRQFEAARQEINDATGLTPVGDDPCALDLFRAGIELKAGNSEAAQQHIAAAMEKVDAPAFVWMQMSSLAAVFRLAREIRKDFDDRLSGEITKKLTSETAGRIARFLIHMRATQAAYVGRASHERLFLRQLTKTKKIAWQADDLKSVCRVLKYFPAQKKFRRELLDLGVTTYPAVPQFAFWAGLEELDSSRSEAGELRMERLLSVAISTHNTGPQKLTEKELDLAMSTLASVREMIEERQEFGRYSAFDFDDDDEFDDDDFDPFFGEVSDEPDSRMPAEMPILADLMDMLGLSDDDEGPEPDEEIMKMLEQSMPPELKRQIKTFAKTLGLTEKETIRRMARKMLRTLENAGTGDAPSGKPSAGTRKTSRRPF